MQTDIATYNYAVTLSVSLFAMLRFKLISVVARRFTQRQWMFNHSDLKYITYCELHVSVNI
jgi:hypothetical protein